MSSSSRRGRVLRGVAVGHSPHPPTDHSPHPPTGHSARLSTAGPLDIELTPPVDPAAGLIAVQEGYEAGFERGYTEGFDSGREKAAAEEAAVMARLERAHHALSLAARALHERQALELAGLERDITAAAFELAEAVVGRELALAASPGLEAVARALRLAPPGEAAVVRLHPADAAEVNRAVEPGGAVDPSRNLTVVADERVEPGGCVVEAGDCRVDAQISPALARVRDALLGAPELTGAGR